MRVLFWLILLSVFLWALRGLVRTRPPVPGKPGKEGEEMVRDPQCGVYLPVSKAVSGRVGGKTEYFCSRECEDRYRSGEPGRS